MNCAKCGSALEAGARFCGGCGSVVENAAVPKTGARHFDRTMFQGSGGQQPGTPAPTPAATPAVPPKREMPEALMQTMAAPSPVRPPTGAAPAAPPASAVRPAAGSVAIPSVVVTPPSSLRPAAVVPPSAVRPAANPTPSPVAVQRPAPNPTPSPVAAPAPGPAATQPAPPVAEDFSGDLTGKMINNRYQINDRLGEGGFGTVYLAEQVAMGRQCALKVLHPRMARDQQVVGRFKREAQAASGLRNPHTVQIYDFDQTPEGVFYLAMEMLKGRSLHAEMAKGPISVGRVIHIMDGIVDSLGEAHAQGIVHRDVKPENVFLETRGPDTDYVKVLDFGIAKIVSGGDGGKGGPALTAAGQTLGTLEYMSPEQLMGLQLDGRSDLYAVGILAFELLTGHLPFPAKNSGEMITHHLKTVPTPPSKSDPHLKIPSLVDAVILRLLEKDRAKRYANSAELQADLRRIEGALATATAAAPTAAPVVSMAAPAPVAPVAAPQQAPVAMGPPPAAAMTQPIKASSGKSGLSPMLILALVVVGLLVVGLIILLVTRKASADEGPPAPARLIPSTMTHLLSGDLAAIRASAPREQQKQLDAALRPQLAEMGAEPGAIGKIALAGVHGADGADQPTMMIVDGRFNRGKLDAWARKNLSQGRSFASASYKGTKYEKVDEDAYALFGDRVVTTGHTPIASVIDLQKGEGSRLVDGPAAGMLGRVGAANGRGPTLFGWMQVDDNLRHELPTATHIDKVQEGAASLQLGSNGADLKLSARTGSDDDGKEVTAAMTTFLDGARKDSTVALLGFGSILQAVKVTNEGPYAEATVHLSKTQYDSLVVRLAGFAATAAHAAADETTPAPPLPAKRHKN